MLVSQPTLQQQDGQPPKQMEGGETFIQRMKRLQGQQSAQTAGVPVDNGQQTSPYDGHSFNAPSGSSRPPSTSQFHPAAHTQATPSSPVSGDGKIPPPQVTSPVTYAAPQAVSGPLADGNPNSAPSLKPGWVDAGNGMVKNSQTGQIVPMNHPIYQNAANAPVQPTTQSPSVPAADGSGNGSLAAPLVRPQNTELQPYALDQTPFSTYQGQQFTGVTPDAYKADAFSQFQNPTNGALESGTANLAQAILGNPQSMGEDVVAGMKNAQKEDALLQAKQAMMQNASSAAARGVLTGGNTALNDRRIQDATNSDILSGNRAIDAQAAQTNFANRLQAMGAVNDLLNSQMGRATSAYDATLSGQQAQSAANEAAAQSRLQTSQADLARQAQQADENFRAFGTKQQAEQANLQRQLNQFQINQAIAGSNLDNYKTDSSNYFAQRGANLADQQLAADIARNNRSLDIQQQLGEGGLSLDQQRLAAANDQFNKNYGLNIMQFLEGKREADNNLGYNYNVLNTNGQSQLFDFLKQNGLM